MNSRTFGARLTRTGAVFRLWAPSAGRVDVELEEAHPMRRDGNGWFSADIEGVRAGAHYRFRINGAENVPDPASAFQPEDIAGPSELIDHCGYNWRASDWRGRPWHEAVIIETHVGTFTPEGTYRAMIGKLDHLKQTGFTAIELMPLADFAGRRNWGYDGVLWYAPDCAFGRPDDLKALIDEAHLRGMMVFLDVVYNHFGPEGNYLGQYAPEFFTEAQTPWGSAINYALPEVRAFAIENAMYWLRAYRFDGLRLDAVHAIIDHGDDAMLRELSRAVGELARKSGRHIHLMLENDNNTATLLDPVNDPPSGLYRAQWNDDYHHAMHVLLSGEDKGYYNDYAPDPARHLARTLGSGFAYQGEPSPHRNGQLRGEPSRDLAPLAFVNFIQNHDQIGNRALGDRLTTLLEPAAVEAGLALTLLAPMVPMLFMGDEWGSKAPFPFFCDFSGELAEAIREGRRKEFASAYARYGGDVPDPLDDATFQSAKLDWNTLNNPEGSRHLALVRQLLAVRHAEIIPRLPGARFGNASHNGEMLHARWHMGDGTLLHVLANLSDKALAGEHQPWPGRHLWGGEIPSDVVAPWAVHWRLGDA